MTLIDGLILERNPQLGDLSYTLAEYLLPKARYRGDDSATIINKSIERLLELSKRVYEPSIVH